MTEDMFRATDEALAKQEARALLNDPKELLVLLQENVKGRLVAEQQRDEYKSDLDKYFDSDGYIDAAIAAEVLRIPYIAPDGTKKLIGRNYAIQLLEMDGVIVPSGALPGYRPHSSWKEDARAFPVPKNGHLKSVVRFTPKGMRRLIAKYRNDDRRFYSTTDRVLCFE